MEYFMRLVSILFVCIIPEVSSMDSAMIGIIASSSCAGLLFIIIVVVAVIAAAWNDCYYDRYISKLKRSTESRYGASSCSSDVISLHRVRPGLPYPWLENGYPPPGIHYINPDENIEHEFYMNPAEFPYPRYPDPIHPPGLIVTELQDDRNPRPGYHNAPNRLSGGTYQTSRHSQSLNTLQRDGQPINSLHQDNQPMATLQRESHHMNTLQREDQQKENTLQRHHGHSMNNIQHHSASNLSHAHSDRQLNQFSGITGDTTDRTTETDEKELYLL